MDHSGIQVTCMIALPAQHSASYDPAAVLRCGILEVCCPDTELDQNVAG